MKFFRYVAIVVCTGGAWLVCFIASILVTSLEGGALSGFYGRPKARWALVKVFLNYFSFPGEKLVIGAFICSLLFTFRAYKILAWAMAIFFAFIMTFTTGATMSDLFQTVRRYGYRVGILWLSALMLNMLNAFIPATATLSMFYVAYDTAVPFWASLVVRYFYIVMTLAMLIFHLVLYKRNRAEIARAEVEWLDIKPEVNK